MTAARRDPPGEWIKDVVYYKDGALYWVEGAEGNNKRAARKGYDLPIGSIDDKGYLRVTLSKDGESRSIKVHRLIYWLHTGEWPGQVDHKDGDPLNNHIENLRPASAQQNATNRVKMKCKAGYYGVRKDGIKYTAQVTIDGKSHTIYGFHDAKHAALFRDLWASMVYGEFAVLNFLGKQPIRINGELVA